MADSDLVKCRPGCIYEGDAGGLRVCNYIFEVGHRRPCPAGPDCTEWTSKKHSKRKWDKELARKLYDAGKSQKEISVACHVDVQTVRKWMREQNLSPNGRGRLRKDAPPVDGVDSATHADADSGPSGCREFALELVFDGIKVSVTAFGAAAQNAPEYVRKLLELFAPADRKDDEPCESLQSSI